MASLNDLESWLIAITQHTRVASEILERIEGKLSAALGLGGGFGGGGGSAARSFRMFDAAVTRLESFAGQQAVALAQRGQGLAQRGMQGTVEQAQNDYAMQQLSLQLAAVFKPITQALTYFASKTAQMFQKMDGKEQNRLLGMLGGGILGNMLGGPRGAVAGMMMGPGIVTGVTGEGPGPNDARMGAVGGALLGSRLGPWGAAGGAVVGAAASGGFGAYYDDARGHNRAAGASNTLGSTMAFFQAGAGVIGDLLGVETAPRRRMDARRAGAAEEAAAARRDVTPFSAEMGDAGSLFFKLQENVVRATAGPGFEDGGPFKPFMDVLIDIVILLGKLAGVPIAVPRSADEARFELDSPTAAPAWFPGRPIGSR